MLCKKLYIFRQYKCQPVVSGIYGDLKDTSYIHIRSKLSSRFSTCRRKQTTLKEPESSKAPPQETIGQSKKGVIVATGSVLITGSLFALWYSRTSKRKKIGESIKKDQSTVVPKIPSDSKDIPDKVPYLLIGGGTTSFSAFRAIKSNDATAKVLVISEEPYYPYMRPPLSKEMILGDNELVKKLSFRQWNGTERSVFYEPDDFYTTCDKLMSEKKGGVAVARGWRVVKIDPFYKKVTLDDGKVIEYDKCLVATGSRPKIMSPFDTIDSKYKDKILTLKTIDDFLRIYNIVSKGSKSIAIIGGSFLGSELACSIASSGNGKNLKIKQIFEEEGNLAEVIPRYLSLWSTSKIRNLGVDIDCNTAIKNVALSADNSQVVLQLNGGNEIKVDHVIIAGDSEPVTDLADISGLETHPQLGGFVVNTELSARTDLYAAGECSCFYDIKFGRRRIGHHDHAVVSGRLVGENMTGAGKPYWHQSMFWSDLGPDIGFEGVGIVDSTLPTVAIFAKPSDDHKSKENKSEEKSNTPVSAKPLVTAAPVQGEDYSKGVIFYLRDDVIVGVVLWNLFNKMNVARQILKEPKKYDDLNEVAKLFDIHQE